MCLRLCTHTSTRICLCGCLGIGIWICASIPTSIPMPSGIHIPRPIPTTTSIRTPTHTSDPLLHVPAPMKTCAARLPWANASGPSAQAHRRTGDPGALTHTGHPRLKHRVALELAPRAPGGCSTRFYPTIQLPSPFLLAVCTRSLGTPGAAPHHAPTIPE